MRSVDLSEPRTLINYSIDRVPSIPVTNNGLSYADSVGSQKNLLLVGYDSTTAKRLKLEFDLLGKKYPSFCKNDFGVIASSPDVPKIADVLNEYKPAAIVLQTTEQDGGITLLHHIRELPSNLPLVVVPSRAAYYNRSEEENRNLAVDFLNAGADQYIDNPFLTSVLAATVMSTIRRAEWAEPSTPPVPKTYSNEEMGIELDINKWLVTKRGIKVKLRPAEMKLLTALATTRGNFTSYDRLSRQFGFGDKSNSLASNHFRVLTHELRQKLEEDPLIPRLIVTIPGLGYKCEFTLRS